MSSRAKPLPDWAVSLVTPHSRDASMALSAALSAHSTATARAAEAQLELERSERADEAAAERAVTKGGTLPQPKTPAARAKLEQATRLVIAAERKRDEASGDLLASLLHGKDDVLADIEARRREIGDKVAALCDQIEVALVGARQLDVFEDALTFVDGSHYQSFSLSKPPVPEAWLDSLTEVRALVGVHELALRVGEKGGYELLIPDYGLTSFASREEAEGFIDLVDRIGLSEATIRLRLERSGQSPEMPPDDERWGDRADPSGIVHLDHP